MTDSPPPAAEPDRTVLTRIRRMASLIPTSSLITAGGVALLAMTAGLGGLAETPTPPIPELAVGEQFTGSDLQMTVQSVQLRTERGNALVFPDEEAGERVLAVTVQVVNTFSAPRPATSLSLTSAVVDGIHVLSAAGAQPVVTGKPTISRADGTDGSTLQPDVPAELVLAWLVGPDDLHDGDELRLALPDSTHLVGTNVLRGQDYWTDVVVGATVIATVHESTPLDETDMP